MTQEPKITIRKKNLSDYWWTVKRNRIRAGYIQKSMADGRYKVRNDLTLEPDRFFDTLEEAKAFAMEDQKQTPYYGDD